MSISVATQIAAIDRNNLPRSSEAGSECACHCSPPLASARSREQLTLLPAIALVLLPKCPLCLAAWFGVLGSLGASSWLRSIWGTPLAVILLSFAIASLVLRARGSGDPRPLLLGVLGATALLSGKYGLDLPFLVYAGFALLTGASFWSSWPQSSRTRRFESCQ